MTKAKHAFLLLLLAALAACAPPSAQPRVSRLLSAGCLTDVATLNRNESRCGIALGWTAALR